MLTNNFRRFVLAFIVTVAVVLSLTTFRLTVTAQTPVNLPQKAKAEVSRNTGIPVDRLTVGNQATLADTDIKRFKVIDSEDNTYSIFLDAAGNQVSEEVVNQITEAFHNKGFVGKLEVALNDLLKQGSNKPIRVIISLKEKEPIAPSRGRTPAERQANLNKLRDRYAAIEQPIVALLKANGQEVIYQSPYAPIVGASVSPSVIYTIAAHPDVQRISLENQSSLRLNVSRIVVQANTVNSRGLTGLDETVGIIEAGKIGSHPNLLQTNYIICDATNPTEYPPVGISSHKTNVAGVIQSTNATYRGIAPNINIVDGIVTAALSDMELMAATDCTINYASATNMSFGFETNGNFDEFARYLDRVVYETGATIVVAASNFCNQKSGSPDIAFNVINVGHAGDNNTTSFADDIVPCTNGIVGSYLNPDSFYMDRKEPDVVAPGVDIITTGRNGGFEIFGDPSVGGTSAAAPHVTAGVGLLTQRKPDLFSKAAEVRAIIMASARHNLEGDSRLSDRDGAGGVMLAAADAVVANGLSDYITNDGSAPNFPISKTFTATSGQKVRVAIAQGKNGLVDIR